MKLEKIARKILPVFMLVFLVVISTKDVRAASWEPVTPILESCGDTATGVRMPRFRSSGTAREVQVDTYYTGVQEAAQELRRHMLQRESEITIGFLTDSADIAIMHEILDAATAHTGDPKQGDYLRWQYGGCEFHLGGETNGIEYRLTLTYIFSYYTTAEQEAQMDQAVAALLEQLDVWDRDDYTKVTAIYDYLCDNITYDKQGLAAKDSMLIYTAYAALINKTCVCQGYATLFYRLALELGVDARVITGIGNGDNHAWNIVKLDGRYYNLDATWDAPIRQLGRQYQYFLRANANFGSHTASEEYLSPAFLKVYPINTADYVPGVKTVGDMDGNSIVDDRDAIYLLRYVLFPDVFPIDQDADVDDNGIIADTDAVYLLRHTLFPDRFPLYPAAL